MHCSLRLPDIPSVILSCFVLCMRKDCYFPASDQHSDIAIGFSDPSLLKDGKNFVIR